jgi:hypothetical protein
LDEDGGSSAAEHAGLNPNAVSFIARFDEEMSLVGYPKAHLFVEARGADDMDLFVLIQKLVGNAVSRLVERCALRKTPFDHRPISHRWLQDPSSSQQLQHLIKVACR